MRLRSLCAALLLTVSAAASAQDGPDAALQQFLSTLKYSAGQVAIEQAHARLNLKPGYRFLPAADARRVLEDFWGNPPDDTVLGLVVPDAEPLGSEHSWAVVLTYSGEGYVSDEDAKEIDYAELLADMKSETADTNEAMKEAGYPSVDLVGWASAPRYDAAAHKLHWAKELAFEGHDGHTVNYDVRVLGRHGYLSMNAVADMDDLPRVDAGMGEVLAMAEFEPGYRYEEFNAATDHAAEYGLAALVGGGLAAKSGLFAKLGLLLAKGWKLVAIALFGLVAVGRKLFGKEDEAAAT
jgi:uncharacterized membrane-anchored protein